MNGTFILSPFSIDICPVAKGLFHNCCVLSHNGRLKCISILTSWEIDICPFSDKAFYDAHVSSLRGSLEGIRV